MSDSQYRTSPSRELLARLTYQKITLFRDQITKLKGSNFAYDHSKEALNLLTSIADENIELLESAESSGNRTIISGACSTINSLIFDLLPVIGIILRSTHIRNSFEYYYCLLELSKSLIGPDARLILSSEWIFSPMTYPLNIEALPNFVIIGSPASEAGNALILPLAGHEVGHSVWNRSGLEKRLQREITKAIVDTYAANSDKVRRLFGLSNSSDILQNLFVARNIGTALKYLNSQCEETFCDSLGAILFGEGYLYAFLYLLAPNVGGVRSAYYPTLKNRAIHLSNVASEGGWTFPEHFPEYFFEDDPDLSLESELALDMADECAAKLLPLIFEEAKSAAAKPNVVLPSSEEKMRIIQKLDFGIPANNSKNIANIVNAGWDVRLRKQDNMGDIDILNDLILKSIEVLEFHTRTSADNDL